MMNVAEYRRSMTRLADFLPWAALVEKGVVLNKDGSFQRTARFRGPDLDSAVPAELAAGALAALALGLPRRRRDDGGPPTSGAKARTRLGQERPTRPTPTLITIAPSSGLTSTLR